VRVLRVVPSRPSRQCCGVGAGTSRRVSLVNQFVGRSKSYAVAPRPISTVAKKKSGRIRQVCASYVCMRACVRVRVRVRARIDRVDCVASVELLPSDPCVCRPWTGYLGRSATAHAW
jgi:hypothetical protein